MLHFFSHYIGSVVSEGLLKILGGAEPFPIAPKHIPPEHLTLADEMVF